MVHPPSVQQDLLPQMLSEACCDPLPAVSLGTYISIYGNHEISMALLPRRVLKAIYLFGASGLKTLCNKQLVAGYINQDVILQK